MTKNHGIYINMPVLCVGEHCEKCPNLHVRTVTVECNDDLGRVHKESQLSCSNLKNCLKMKNFIDGCIENLQEVKK